MIYHTIPCCFNRCRPYYSAHCPFGNKKVNTNLMGRSFSHSFQVRSSEASSCLIYGLAANDSFANLDILDRLRIHIQRVLLKDDDISQLARFQ